MPTDGITIAIRRVVEEEIDLLDLHLGFGDPAKHRERFGKQQSGEVVYLIAWNGGLPVGHLLVKLQGVVGETWATGLEDCPSIVDLLVTPEYRSREHRL